MTQQHQQHSYLVFRINNSFYGVSTYSVREIFALPEITAIPKARQGIVGVIDVRGQIIPVIDFNLAGRSQFNPYSLDDRAIVVEWRERNLAIIVDEVYEVRNLALDTTVTDTGYEGLADFQNQPFVADVVRSETDILVILDLENLFNYGMQGNLDVNSLNSPTPIGLLPGRDSSTASNGDLTLAARDSAMLVPHSPVNSSIDISPQFSPEVLAILRKRAERLREIDEVRHNTNFISNLAIVVLNNELFGLELEHIREFTNLEQPIPVPCCPPHIIGNMNLRGEILTLVDICHLLNLPPINLTEVSQLMVVEVDDLRVGLTIEKVCDAIAVDTDRIDLVPAANYSANKEYFKGTLTYQERIVSILDVAKILRNGNLIVDRA